MPVENSPYSPDDRARILAMMKKRGEEKPIQAIAVEEGDLRKPVIKEPELDTTLTTPDASDLTINFADLPRIWQEHILKRKAEGKLPSDKNTFTKREILKASGDKTSFTPTEIVGKVFDRVKKEKINLVDLPLKWQEILNKEKASGNIAFDNVTVEYLLRRGARSEDINKIRERIAKKKELAEEGKLDDVRERIVRKRQELAETAKLRLETSEVKESFTQLKSEIEKGFKSTRELDPSRPSWLEEPSSEPVTAESNQPMVSTGNGRASFLGKALGWGRAKVQSLFSKRSWL